ncbi:Biotin synthase [compost metagenome]
MPAATARLSAGRIEMTETEQAWCFMAGANSIFTGERETLLVTPNPGISEDMLMLQNLGLKPLQKEAAACAH